MLDSDLARPLPRFAGKSRERDKGTISVADGPRGWRLQRAKIGRRRGEPVKVDPFATLVLNAKRTQQLPQSAETVRSHSVARERKAETGELRVWGCNGQGQSKAH